MGLHCPKFPRMPSQPPSHSPTHSLHPSDFASHSPGSVGWHNHLRGWTCLLLLTLAWDVSGADLRVMAWLGDPEGFALRDDWWLSAVLHDGARQLALTLYLGVLLMAIWPVAGARQLPGLMRLEMATGITLSLLVVNLVKRSSLTSCPWELQAFGGVASYVSHWSWGVADGGSGFCFPGGHASSALAFLALALPGLHAAHPQAQRRSGIVTGLVLCAGFALGGVQTLRGAHYPSHTAWTALLCAAAAWANHAGFVTFKSWQTRKISARP